MPDWTSLFSAFDVGRRDEAIVERILRELLTAADRRGRVHREALEYACVVHFFDRAMMRAFVAARGFKVEGEDWFDVLRAYPFTHQHPRLGLTIHEDVRRIVRRLIWEERRDDFRALNGIALAWWTGDRFTAMTRAERFYHELALTDGEELDSLDSEFEQLATRHLVGEVSLLIRYVHEYDELLNESFATRSRYYDALLADLESDWKRAELIMRQLLATLEQEGLFGVRLRRSLGDTLLKQSAWDEAETMYWSALRELRNLGLAESSLYGHVLQRIGLTSYRRGRWSEAEQAVTDALTILQRADDRGGQAVCLDDLAKIVYRRGEWSRGLQIVDQAIRGFQAISDLRGEGWTLITRTRILRRMKRFEEALASGSRAEELIRRVGDEYGRARVLHILGECLVYTGQVTKALALLDQSIDIKRRIGDRDGLAQSLDTLGWLLLHEGVFPRAHTILEEARRLTEQLGDRYFRAKVLHHLGELSDAQGFGEQAYEYYRESLTLRRAIGDLFGEAEVLQAMGDHLAGRGDEAGATVAYEEAGRIFVRLEDPERLEVVRARLRGLGGGT